MEVANELWFDKAHQEEYLKALLAHLENLQVREIEEPNGKRDIQLTTEKYKDAHDGSTTTRRWQGRHRSKGNRAQKRPRGLKGQSKTQRRRPHWPAQLQTSRRHNPIPPATATVTAAKGKESIIQDKKENTL